MTGLGIVEVQAARLTMIVGIHMIAKVGYVPEENLGGQTPSKERNERHHRRRNCLR